MKIRNNLLASFALNIKAKASYPLLPAAATSFALAAFKNVIPELANRIHLVLSAGILFHLFLTKVSLKFFITDLL